VNCFDATVRPHLACKLCFTVVVSRYISKTFMCTSYVDDNLNTLIPVEPVVKLASSFIQYCHNYTVFTSCYLRKKFYPWNSAPLIVFLPCHGVIPAQALVCLAKLI